MLSVRLLDVFVSGPIRILVSRYIKNENMKRYLFLEGLLVILFNAYNYLYFEKNYKYNIKFLNNYSDKIKGKPQIHRLLLLTIMYPNHINIIMKEKIPKNLRTIFIINLILGFSYNLYNFVKYF